MRPRSILLSVLMLGPIASPAAGKVYQIEADGTVLVRQAGAAVGWERADGRGRKPAAAASARPTRTAFAAFEARVEPGSVAPAPATAPKGTLDGNVLLHQAASQAGLHPAVLEALVWQESRWKPGAVSRKGAIGLTQLMPDTARALGVDPRDPVANLNGGARHLRSLLDRFDGDLVKALAAYNAGARRVEAWNGVPPIAETQNYVASILGRLQRTPLSR
ncbi:lytic transglycosylase domain-containing protein [Novosphingobium aerophilum]|nr:lytic transglycosylase domain-containing protein [Novosphingobium aerophilum]